MSRLSAFGLLGLTIHVAIVALLIISEKGFSLFGILAVSPRHDATNSCLPFELPIANAQLALEDAIVASAPSAEINRSRLSSSLL